MLFPYFWKEKALQKKLSDFPLYRVDMGLEPRTVCAQNPNASHDTSPTHSLGEMIPW